MGMNRHLPLVLSLFLNKLSPIHRL